MEQISVNENGNGSGGRVGLQIQLPIGFRFRPTDEELLLHYLKPKVYSSPFPSSVIPVLDHDSIIFHSHPSHLPGDPKERRHFFYKRKRDSYGKICSRIRITTSDGSGYWKPIGKEKTIHIVAPGLLTEPLVGIKKSMVFYQGKPPQGLKTPWILHEYRLLPSQTTHNSTHQELENWVVCRINQRTRKSKNHGSNKKTTRNLEEKVIRPNSDDVMDFFMILDSSEFVGPPPLPPSPSCSSGSTISFTPYGFI